MGPHGHKPPVSCGANSHGSTERTNHDGPDRMMQSGEPKDCPRRLVTKQSYVHAFYGGKQGKFWYNYEMKPEENQGPSGARLMNPGRLGKPGGRTPSDLAG